MFKKIDSENLNSMGVLQDSNLLDSKPDVLRFQPRMKGLADRIKITRRYGRILCFMALFFLLFCMAGMASAATQVIVGFDFENSVKRAALPDF